MGRLIERGLPVEVLSRDAAIEMSFKPRPAYRARCRELGLRCGGGFYDPKIRSLHPWPARRPRSLCRAINLACVLPEDVDLEEYLGALGFSREELARAVSRGYPPLISYTRVDREVVRRYSPSVERVVLLDPMAGGGSIPLESAILGLRTIAVEYNPVAYLVLRATVEFPARYGMELYRRVRSEAVRLVEWARSRLGRYYREGDGGYIVVRGVRCGRGHVRPLAPEVRLAKTVVRRVRVENPCGCRLADPDRLWAQQHRRLMTSGEDVELLLATHIYVCKQVGEGFTDLGEGDLELVIEAYRRYLELRERLALPRARIPRANRALSKVVSAGLDSFDLLMNPRQALAIGSIASYIRDRARELYEAEGEFGAAVALYLALGLSRVFNFNSVPTTWNHHTKTIRDSLASYFSRRVFAVDNVYAEAVVPYRTLYWVFEPDGAERRETSGGILPALRELCEALEGVGDRVVVYQGDALRLSQYLGQPVDIVHVDPPYYDVHVYSDMSELPWNVLRTALEPVLGPLFSGSLLDDWSPDRVEVPRASEVVARSREEGPRFEALLSRFLAEARRVLRDDGVLVLWFSHREWRAWEALVESLRRAGLCVVRVYPAVSEHPTRLATRGGTRGFSRALIIVARKRERCRQLSAAELESEVERVVEEAALAARRARVREGSEPPESEVALLAAAAALSLLTRAAEEELPRARQLVARRVGELLESARRGAPARGRRATERLPR